MIYAGYIMFWYNEQEGMYTELLGNPKVFLAVSRDHAFLLSHSGIVLHVSHTYLESNHNYVKNSSSSSSTHMQVSSLNPSDP